MPQEIGNFANLRVAALESRNAAEMARMIEVTRSYTQIATLLAQHADLQRSAVDKLAEVPN